MSSRAISLTPPLTRAPLPTLMLTDIEDFKIYKSVSNVFLQISSNTPLQLHDSNLFARDRQVVGLNRIWLIPYTLEKDDDNLWDEAHALAPLGSDHCIEDDSCPYGRGFLKSRVKIAIRDSKKYDLPYRKMRSPIEGGNCYVFFDSQGRPKAIVGILSVVLTLIALEEQKYFVKKREMDECTEEDTHEEYTEELNLLIASIHNPSDTAVRRARNMDLLTVLYHKEDNEEGDDPDYRKSVLAPVTEEDRVKYLEKAREWEAKERLAYLVIAEDLQIPLENIAFVPQREFHIDMEMFVGPNGDDVYVDTASFQPDRIDALQKVARRILPVAGVHTVSGKSITFMNGVFVSTHYGPHFVTNGGSDTKACLPLYRAFRTEIEITHNSGFKVAFVPTMDKVLSEKHGGIHCATSERSTYKTPLDIILLGYHAGEPVPFDKVREVAWDVLHFLDTPLCQKEAQWSRKRKAVDSDTSDSDSDTSDFDICDIDGTPYLKRLHSSESSWSEAEIEEMGEEEEDGRALSPTVSASTNFDPDGMRGNKKMKRSNQLD